MIVRALLTFVVVLLLIPQQTRETDKAAAPASGVLAALQTAVLADIVQVRADIAESQRERGGSVFRKI